MTNAVLMLNDFCFLEIFKHLSLHELANVKEAFKCLDAITDMAFKQMTRGKYYFQSEIDSYDKYDPERSKQIIKQFGSSLHTLTVLNVSLQETNWSEIFSSINQHCKKKLTNLSLNDKNLALVTKADAFLIIDVLKNLETIELVADDQPHSSEFFEILCYCEKVKSIKLFNRIDIDLHKTIFRRNKNLLKLRWCGGLKDSNTKKIVDNLMNTRLEEMCIYLPRDTSRESFAELKRLNYLKHLDMDGSVKDFTPFLQIVDAFDSLKSLTLNILINDRVIATLGRMTRLKILKLHLCTLSTNIYSSFQSLFVLCGNKSLEHLIFLCKDDRFDLIDTANFLQIIEKRKTSISQKCFHLVLKHTVYTASLEAIPFELLEANKETIKVIDGWDSNYEYYSNNFCTYK